ncbi:MAG: GNAT family N-acetyltransferase [Fusobacteriaceae bacterium]
MSILFGVVFFILGSLIVYVFQKKIFKGITEEDVVCEVVQKSFIRVKNSEHNEHKLVRELLKSDAFIKELSLTAKFQGSIVGYILFTKIKVGEETLLALAPLAVLPKYQKKGIGKSLIEKGHKVGKDLGYKGVVLLGDPNYYKKFGYSSASKWGIKSPVKIADENFMAIELYPDSLIGIKGVVQYPKEFGI